MIEGLKDLYMDSGVWGQPILYSTLILFVAGWVMMFTVRLIKRFILFSIIALLLPNALGVIGYIEKSGDVKEAIIERGKEFSNEMTKSVEDIEFSPMYLGFIGSALTVVVGLAGVVKAHRRNRSKHNEVQKANK